MIVQPAASGQPKPASRAQPAASGQPWREPSIPEFLVPPMGDHPPKSEEGLRDACLTRARREAEACTKDWLQLAEVSGSVLGRLSKIKILSAEALASVLSLMPSGPHARLLKLAMLSSVDLTTTLEGVVNAAATIGAAMKEVTPVEDPQ